MNHSFRNSPRSNCSIRNSSSKKIRDLYSEFEALKLRMNRGAKQKEDQIIEKVQQTLPITLMKTQSFAQEQSRNKKLDDYQYGSGMEFIKISNHNHARFPPQFHEKKQIFKSKTSIKKSFDDFLNEDFASFYQKIDIKMRQLEYKAEKVQKCVKFAKQLIKSNQIKHNEELKKLKQSYEEKVSMIINDSASKDVITFSTSTSKLVFNSIHQLQEQFKNMEEKLLIKDTEINNLKIEASRQRRIIDHLKSKDETDNTLVKSLQQQLFEKDRQIDDLRTKQKNQTALLDKINRLQMEIKQKNKEIQYLESNSKQSMNDKQDNLSENSDPIRNKPNYRTVIRKLSLQADLISQQNRYLQYKKLKFENQMKAGEKDEQRFIQQSSILKDEVKRLNTALIRLDDISLQAIKGGKITKEIAQKLQQGLKVREYYLSKFTQKQQSSKHS